MTAPAARRTITTLAELEALHDAPLPNTLRKELDRLTPEYRAYVERAPFVVIATAGPDGLDCSPRGDPPGFVRVRDERTVLIPDRRGNNRLDSLRNLVVDPRISLLFLIPGIGETLRINGRASIVVDPALAATFAIGDKLPKLVLEVAIERVYYQCPKALIRSRLWDPAVQVSHAEVPTSGQIMARITAGEVDADAHDRAYPERIRQTIY